MWQMLLCGKNVNLYSASYVLHTLGHRKQ